MPYPIVSYIDIGRNMTAFIKNWSKSDNIWVVSGFLLANGHSLTKSFQIMLRMS